jgi:hypothetical protein
MTSAKITHHNNFTKNRVFLDPDSLQNMMTYHVVFPPAWPLCKTAGFAKKKSRQEEKKGP